MDFPVIYLTQLIRTNWHNWFGKWSCVDLVKTKFPSKLSIIQPFRLNHLWMYHTAINIERKLIWRANKNNKPKTKSIGPKVKQTNFCCGLFRKSFIFIYLFHLDFVFLFLFYFLKKEIRRMLFTHFFFELIFSCIYYGHSYYSWYKFQQNLIIILICL